MTASNRSATAVTSEIAMIAALDCVRGADLWHLAVALFLDPEREIDFLTLDVRQRDIARRLGFSAP